MYMTWARFRLLGCACALIGCASGYVDNPVPTASSVAVGTIGTGGKGGAAGKGSAGTGAKTGTAGGGAAGMGSTAVSTAKTGDPCVPGTEPTCTCDSTHTMGVRICKFDPNSTATMGTYSDCQSCAPPLMTPDAGTGDVMLIDAGTAGTGGTGGTGGSGGRTGGGGSGGTRAPTMMQPTAGKACSSPCTNSCFPVGILPCCSPLGTCGCTWAPGAYCL